MCVCSALRPRSFRYSGICALFFALRFSPSPFLSVLPVSARSKPLYSEASSARAPDENDWRPTPASPDLFFRVRDSVLRVSNAGRGTGATRPSGTRAEPRGVWGRAPACITSHASRQAVSKTVANPLERTVSPNPALFPMQIHTLNHRRH